MTPSEQMAKARELVALLPIWGMSLADAKRITLYMRSELLPMTEAEFQALAKGASLIPPTGH